MCQQVGKVPGQEDKRTSKLSQLTKLFLFLCQTVRIPFSQLDHSHHSLDVPEVRLRLSYGHVISSLTLLQALFCLQTKNVGVGLGVNRVRWRVGIVYCFCYWYRHGSVKINCETKEQQQQNPTADSFRARAVNMANTKLENNVVKRPRIWAKWSLFSVGKKPLGK